MRSILDEVAEGIATVVKAIRVSTLNVLFLMTTQRLEEKDKGLLLKQNQTSTP
jgi:uncharacterized membrane protein YadS